jgi:hypothetical protein
MILRLRQSLQDLPGNTILSYKYDAVPQGAHPRQPSRKPKDVGACRGLCTPVCFPTGVSGRVAYDMNDSAAALQIAQRIRLRRSGSVAMPDDLYYQ